MCVLAGKRWSEKGGDCRGSIRKVRASGVLLHWSMSPYVRRECARWWVGLVSSLILRYGKRYGGKWSGKAWR